MTDTTKERAQQVHTPGPWTVSQYINYQGFSIWAPEAGCIAERWYASEHEDAPILANARLIAAAPELMEALEELISKLEDVIDIGKPEFLGRSWAAIRKAKGEEG